ncbi:9790_t:CDS:2, partial [Funneliformis caledonium]
GKQRALALWQSTLTDNTSQWHETKIAGKKFRLNHVAVGNNLANMATVPLPARATGALIIPAHDVHTDEDWSYAGDTLQELYLWRTTYTTEVRKQQELIFGNLIQNNLLIREYYRKLCKYAKLAQIGDHEKRMQFLRGLNPENKLEVKRLGLNRALNNNLIENLEEIEKEKSEMLLGENIYNQLIAQKASINQGITTADVEKIINARIQALLQEQITQSNQL